MNKSFQVLKRLEGSTFSPSFVNEFNSPYDAFQFCTLCQKAEDEKEKNASCRWHFYVVRVLTEGELV